MTVSEYIPRLPLHEAILNRWLELLEDDQTPDSGPNPELIIQLAALAFRVAPSDIRGPRRSQAIAWARGAAMTAVRHQFSFSTTETASFFGKACHGTVLHHAKHIKYVSSIRPTEHPISGSATS